MAESIPGVKTVDFLIYNLTNSHIAVFRLFYITYQENKFAITYGRK